MIHVKAVPSWPRRESQRHLQVAAGDPESGTNQCTIGAASCEFPQWRGLSAQINTPPRRNQCSRNLWNHAFRSQQCGKLLSPARRNEMKCATTTMLQGPAPT
ncbi:hypothetical protein M404DRAFT_1006855 [Pisolithus tinctorius Marx 270]|uniref:Uncharacterized protein n=1 Tax=Pisolithus tinctorius Marx 270 TaxID=870435 RepID=A0A0C3N590_PISTI|nr:hypothetical protein M404DRAFT_1006855 [Pisolithus tinctorius Marx 270]